MVISTAGLHYIILLDFRLALLTFITAIIVFIRYYRVFKIPKRCPIWRALFQ